MSNGLSSAEAQRQLNDQYILVNDGNAPTLSDAIQILPQTYNIPTNIYQLEDFIGAYSIILDIILGEMHPLAIRLRQHHQYWDHNKSMVVNALVVESHGVAILHTLRYIQISCLGYFNDKMYLPNATFPDFGFLEQNIRLRTFGNLPPMPAEFYYSQQANNRSSVATSSATTTAPPSTRTSNARNDDRKADPVKAPEAQIVKDWNERYVAKKKSLYTLRTDAAGKLPKTSDGSTLICLAYHLRGECFDVCRSKSAHHPLNADETTAFQRFVDKHL